MFKFPVLSIILTSYKDLDLFIRINSRFFQMVKNLVSVEFIIVDDSGSYQNAWNEFSFITSEISHNYVAFCTIKNCRQGGARNLALLIAQGDYVWFIDADDSPDIESAIHAVKNRNADIIVNNFTYETNNPKKINLKINGSKTLSSIEILFLLSTNSMSTACWPYFYRRQYLIDNDISFQENVFFEDLVFNIKCFSLKNVLVEYSGIAVYSHIIRPNSSSTTKTLSRAVMRFKQAVVSARLCLKSGNKLRYVSALLIIVYHGIWASK